MMVDLAPKAAPQTGHPDESTRVYRVADVAVAFTGDARVLKAADAVFRRLASRLEYPEQAGLTFDVHSGDGFTIAGAGVAPAMLPNSATPAAVALELSNVVIGALSRMSRFAIVRAAVLERYGRAVALGGASLSGKTTLAAHLMNRGWRLLSDEYAVFDTVSHRVVTFPKLMVVRAASLPHLPRSFRRCCETSPWFVSAHGNDAFFYAVEPASAFGEAIWAGSARLVAFLELDHGTRAPGIDDLDPWTLASRLQTPSWPRAEHRTSMTKMGAALRGVRAGTLHYETHAAASDALEDWFE